jgi:RNA polymerase sigma-70 factor (ECF subfamily)
MSDSSSHRQNSTMNHTGSKPIEAMEDASFSELITRSKAGNREAIDQLIASYRDYLLLVANQSVGRQLQRKVAPSDLVQSACLQAHQHIKDFQGKTQAELLAWLRTILHNELLQTHRQFKTDKRDLEREQSGSALDFWQEQDKLRTPSTEAILNEEAEQLREALLRLSPDHRQAILLRNWERLPFEEIGQRMGRTTDAAKKLWSRAVQQLRVHLPANKASKL